MTGGEQQIISGRGASLGLGQLLGDKSPRSIFLVTGQGSYAASGAERAMAASVAKYTPVRFSDFGSNLLLSEIVEGVRICRQHACDFVVGIGGGSVIDMAKAVSLLKTQSAEPEEYVIGEAELTPRRTGSIMIPTTAGTGSESTHFSVIYVNGSKYSLADLSMLPDVAVLDPALSDSLPPHVTACSGLDALCQGIESFWSIRSTESSRDLSARAIRLCLSNIERAVGHPDEAARDNMLTAANLSGRAINMARTTVAHAASYPLTSRYGITHGQAVALFLPHLLLFNCEADATQVTDRRGHDFVSERLADLVNMLGAGSPPEARDNLMHLIDSLGLETRLSQFGIAAEALDSLTGECLASDRSQNNPVTISKDDMRTILQTML